MILAEVVFQLPPMTLLEIGELTAIVTAALTAAAWLTNLAIGGKYVKNGQCEALHMASDTGRAAALIRVSKLEIDQALTKTHLEQMEEHMRAIDALAARQTELEKAAALSVQPIQEFAKWMEEVKEMLRMYIEKTEERTMDHEKRLTTVETQIKIAGAGRMRTTPAVHSEVQ